MSSDTVNPTPASIARPSTSHQARSASSSARVKRATNHVAPSTPTGLPTTSPTRMPIATGSCSALLSPLTPPTVTPAAKNANTGTATDADSGRHRCSKCSASPGPSPADGRTTGMANPSRMPATVACTPEAWASIHGRRERQQPPRPDAALHRHGEQPQWDEGEQRRDLQIVGIEDRDDRDREQVID